MHESGLVYISIGENVGVDEFQRQSERSGNSSQTQKLAKTILRLSIAMGLEPVVAGQQCDVKDEEGHSRFSLAIFLLVIGFVVFVLVLWKCWKMLRRNIDNIEIQLADHCGYAALFSERIDALGFRLEAVQEARFGMTHWRLFVMA